MISNCIILYPSTHPRKSNLDETRERDEEHKTTWVHHHESLQLWNQFNALFSPKCYFIWFLFSVTHDFLHTTRSVVFS